MDKPETSDAQRVFRFRIGDAFPSADPVARFVTVLATISNDWMRSSEELLRLDDDNAPDVGGRRVMLFRQQAAALYEAVGFIRDSSRRFPQIADFLDALPADAKDELAQVVGSTDSESEHYLGEWIGPLRNTTSHYLELHPDKAKHGKEEATIALEKAADLEGTVRMGDSFGSVRFEFADDILVQLLPDSDDPQPIAELREVVLALARFVQRAFGCYFASRPEGTFTEGKAET